MVNTAQTKMANAMAIYKAPAEALQFCKDMAESFAALTGCNMPQARGVALSCMQMGLSPMDFQRKYHFIAGKPSMKAQAQLAEFRMNEGGTYELGVCDHKSATIVFVDAYKVQYDRSMTRIELMLSRWPWISPGEAKERKLEIQTGWRGCTAKVRELIDAGNDEESVWRAMIPYYKDNYGTETDWRNMLQARLIGESMRSICPENSAGVYTPEEIRDVVDAEYTVPRVTEMRPSAAQAAAAAASYATAVSTDERVADSAANDIAAGGATVNDDDAIDVPFEVSAVDESDPDKMALVAEVRQHFMDAFGDDAPAVIKESCEGRNVTSLHAMDVPQLQEIAAKFKKVVEVKALYAQHFGDTAEAAIKKSCEGRKVPSLYSLPVTDLDQIANNLRQIIREAADAAKNA